MRLYISTGFIKKDGCSISDRTSILQLLVKGFVNKFGGYACIEQYEKISDRSICMNFLWEKIISTPNVDAYEYTRIRGDSMLEIKKFLSSKGISIEEETPGHQKVVQNVVELGKSCKFEVYQYRELNSSDVIHGFLTQGMRERISETLKNQNSVIPEAVVDLCLMGMKNHF